MGWLLRFGIHITRRLTEDRRQKLSMARGILSCRGVRIWQLLGLPQAVVVLTFMTISTDISHLLEAPPVHI